MRGGEVAVCDEKAESSEEAAARWAPWAPELLAKEAPSEEPVTTFVFRQEQACICRSLLFLWRL